MSFADLGTPELLQTDLIPWEIGPYHGALPGPMRLKLSLDGEIIVRGEVETGFLHRGLEKTLELHPWVSAVTYADHLDPDGAIFAELALCLAVEQIAELAVPPRAQGIRIILSEMQRISSHMGYLARMARAVGSETMLHYVLRDRERMLDLFELLTGARFSFNFLRYGGVSADVTEGFIERVLETCDTVQIRLKEYNDLMSFNRSFLKRTVSVAVIGEGAARAAGLTGPNARAAGIVFDARKAHPYSGYEKVDFDIPIGRGDGGVPGDTHDRFLMRLREISQSVDILKQAVDSILPGEFLGARPARGFTVPSGEAYVRVESARGLLGCHVVADGAEKPCRVQFRVPSIGALGLVPELIQGARIEDLPVILASLDIGLSEVDR